MGDYYKLKMAEGLQKRLQTEVDKLKAIKKDYQKSVTARQQLDAQLNENNLVKEELAKVEEDCKVFKLVGPVLVKQDPEEAKQNVSKRIEYISGEIKRQENLIKDYDKKEETCREAVAKIQQQLQQHQVKAAARS